MLHPFLHEIDEVVSFFKTNLNRGLTESEAAQRLSQYGKNELQETGKKSMLAIFFSQLKETMMIILFVAAIISLLLHEYIDAGVIFVIVLLNAFIGFWQEYKAENALAALKKMAVPTVRVRRDGVEQQIAATNLAPGDIIIVEAGNIIPADSRIVLAANLKVQESALTGESESVLKNTNRLSGDDIPLGDRKNMLYMGTIVTYGRAEAVISATGMNTELGKIATMLQQVEDDKTPLQMRLTSLGRSLAWLALLLIVVVATMTYFRGMAIKEIFMTAISMAVAAIPEGLPAVVTIALALGAQKMFSKKSLIRNLPAVETLGSVSVICSDKTGTLTQNEMTVTDIVLPGVAYKLKEITEAIARDAQIELLLSAGALCNDAELTDEPDARGHKAIGDPTETALVIAAQQLGISKNTLVSAMPRVAELPFDSDRKRMTTIHQLNATTDAPIQRTIQKLAHGKSNDYLALTKGSVDDLIDICNHALKDGEVRPLTADIRDEILAENRKMAENGIRVLGTACRLLKRNELDAPETYERQLVYIGMIGMIDPVRPEAIDAVRLCQKAGIRVIMITGDHPLTARAIARELGISNTGKYLTGKELSQMTGAQLKNQIDDISVFARVSPEHKMVIIDALQEQKQIVSMTGDGVNDAPALKSANIGVAMGITGTDVARESADMVLLDDNFATIVAAVKEGRTIYDNIRKFVKYILTGNTGEILVMLTGPILGLPIPLLPIQILWINLVTDGLPAIALGYEEPEKNVMNRPPFKSEEGIFARGIGIQILIMGAFISMISVFTGLWFWQHDPLSNTWQTMIFTTLTFSQMIYALCVRKNYNSIFRTSLLGNKMMIIAVLLTFLLQLMLIYMPFFNNIFRTTPLSAGQLLVALGAAFTVIIVTEIKKWVYRRKDNID
ncbi:MAG: calcium-translocating P-type ATPase, PMCA-type [Candidatus Zhuqueibacterota bacterium]